MKSVKILRVMEKRIPRKERLKGPKTKKKSEKMQRMMEKRMSRKERLRV